MSNRRARVTQADITRAVRGAQAAGLTVSRVEVDGEKIIVLTSPEAVLEQPKSATEQWREKRDARAAQRH